MQFQPDGEQQQELPGSAISCSNGVFLHPEAPRAEAGGKKPISGGEAGKPCNESQGESDAERQDVHRVDSGEVQWSEVLHRSGRREEGVR